MGIVGVLALAAGLMIWRDQSITAPTTTLLAAPPTTAEPVPTTSATTTSAAMTTTTTEEQRVTEVEAILTDLWFGWFDAIYRQDPDALWDVVATTPFHEAGVKAMESLQFDEEPSRDVLSVVVSGVLLDRTDCLVAENLISLPFLAGDPSNNGVNVLWHEEARGWRFATSWLYAGDLWQADCDEVVREVTP